MGRPILKADGKGWHGPMRGIIFRKLAKFIQDNEGRIVSASELTRILNTPRSTYTYLRRMKQNRVSGYQLRMNEKVKEWL